MTDQRGPRLLQGVLTDRFRSLRAGQFNLSREEREARERVRWSVEQEARRSANEKKQKQKSQQEMEDLLTSVPEPEDSDSEEQVEDDGDDDDWEDTEVEEKTSMKQKYNTKSLKHYSREVDRYDWSDRGAAKAANALLRDFGIVGKGKTQMLICPGKVRRERQKWGRKEMEVHDAKPLPEGMYSDGKKTPTLVREETETKVAVPGKRGKCAFRTVTTISNKLQIQDHYPVVSEPGSGYVTHVTPRNGRGETIAKELVAVAKERKFLPKVMGLDGCKVNTGIHKGVFRCF